MSYGSTAVAILSLFAAPFLITVEVFSMNASETNKESVMDREPSATLKTATFAMG